MPLSPCSWRAELDRPETLGPRGVLLRCDELAATQLLTPIDDRNPVLLEARTNTIVTGQNFTARALSIKYDQSKGMLTLEGDGRVDASLYLQQRVGETPKQYRARTIQYWPATKQLQTDRGRKLEISG